MALSIASSGGAVLTEDRHSGEAVDFRNDAFSFWKLPENYRARLQQATEASEPLIRRYLFEEYMSPYKRMPSSAVMTYYRVKRFIPSTVRHWINYAAVRARLVSSSPSRAASWGWR